MRSKVPAFIALVCILVYLAAVVSAAYRVYRSINGQRQQAAKELDGLQSLLSQAGEDFFTESFREAVRKKITDCQVLQGIIVTSSGGGELTFERERGSVIRWEGSSPRFITRFGYSGLRARQVDIPGLRNVNIYSVINTINYEYMVRVLRQTLVAILGALLLSFFTMIVTSLSRTRVQEEPSQGDESSGRSPDYSAEEEAENPGDFSEKTPGGSPESFEGGENFDLPGFDAAGGEIAGDLSPRNSGADMDDDFNLNDFLDEEELDLPGEDISGADLPTMDMFDEDQAEFSDEPLGDLPGEDPQDQGFSYEIPPEPEDGALPDFDLDEPEISGSPGSAGHARPQGLYSPRSSIGWEAYVQDRLTSEIHRCAASEQDLVVLLMECGEGVNCDGALYKKLAGEAVHFFNLQDLSFEKGERGITVIIPNADLEQGIIKAEEFHSRILKNCAGAIHSKNDFLIGISSRSGRLIEAERLLLEASKALEKAKIDLGTPIIAFKSDPEKYREFIRKGSTG
ncbi:MAG: hypothetical protein LBO65_03270 [Spirochaetaceae bacterium]|nr:hypothetical protein [Spirochaetaceae bacterium]